MHGREAYEAGWGWGGALETIVWKLDFKYNRKPKSYTGFFACSVENKLQEGTSGSARAGSGLLWDSRTDILGPRLWQQWYRWRIQGVHMKFEEIKSSGT